MEFINDVKMLGSLELREILLKDIDTLIPESTDSTYTINMSGGVRKRVSLEDCPDDIVFDISGCSGNSYIGIIEIVQSTTVAKNVSWELNNTVNFESFSLQLGESKIIAFYCDGNVYTNISNISPIANDLVYNSELFSTTSGNTTVSFTNNTISEINITQDTNIEFSDIRFGFEYTIILNVFNDSNITFDNLEIPETFGDNLSTPNGTSIIKFNTVNGVNYLTSTTLGIEIPSVYDSINNDVDGDDSYNKKLVTDGNGGLGFMEDESIDSTTFEDTSGNVLDSGSVLLSEEFSIDEIENTLSINNEKLRLLSVRGGVRSFIPNNITTDSELVGGTVVLGKMIDKDFNIFSLENWMLHTFRNGSVADGKIAPLRIIKEVYLTIQGSTVSFSEPAYNDEISISETEITQSAYLDNGGGIIKTNASMIHSVGISGGFNYSTLTVPKTYYDYIGNVTGVESRTYIGHTSGYTGSSSVGDVLFSDHNFIINVRFKFEFDDPTNANGNNDPTSTYLTNYGTVVEKI